VTEQSVEPELGDRLRAAVPFTPSTRAPAPHPHHAARHGPRPSGTETRPAAHAPTLRPSGETRWTTH
jgi:hypothetical protein